jgi:hypothetical protein
MVSRRQHTATAGTALNRHLKNTAQLEIYLSIYTKETVHATASIRPTRLKNRDEWFTKLHVAGSLVLTCRFNTRYQQLHAKQQTMFELPDTTNRNGLTRQRKAN